MHLILEKMDGALVHFIYYLDILVLQNKAKN